METYLIRGTLCMYLTIANFEITIEGVYTIEGVHSMLNICNPYKYSGPDVIHPHALRVTATVVSPIYFNIH